MNAPVAAELTRAERVAQGLAPTVTDRDGLRRLAVLFTKKAATARKTVTTSEVDGVQDHRPHRSAA